MSVQAMSVEDRLIELGITLPEPAAPVANYVPYVISGSLVSISGQISLGPDGLITGKVGADLDEQAAAQAARLCAINIIAQLKAAAGGDLGRVTRIVKLGAFVNCVDGFDKQPQVVNGASDLMVAVFGDAGRHSRAAVGTNALPLNAAVEIDALAELS